MKNFIISMVMGIGLLITIVVVSCGISYASGNRDPKMFVEAMAYAAFISPLALTMSFFWVSESEEEKEKIEKERKREKELKEEERISSLLNLACRGLRAELTHGASFRIEYLYGRCFVQYNYPLSYSHQLSVGVNITRWEVSERRGRLYPSRMEFETPRDEELFERAVRICQIVLAENHC